MSAYSDFKKVDILPEVGKDWCLYELPNTQIWIWTSNTWSLFLDTEDNEKDKE